MKKFIARLRHDTIVTLAPLHFPDVSRPFQKRKGMTEVHQHQNSEKSEFALGQSPEAVALMKTGPLRFGSKVSKIESPQKVGTNYLLPNP
jgi:hypothetical protein